MTEHDAMFIRRLNTLSVHHTTAWCCQVLHAALPRPVDIISKGEECVARARHTIQPSRPYLSLFLGQRRRHSLELGFPLRLFPTLEDFPTHEQVDRVCLLGTLHAMFEREREDARMMTEPPQVRFTSRKSSAVDTGLLACSQTDDGAVFRIRDAVGLRVFQRERGHEQIRQGMRGKLQSRRQ